MPKQISRETFGPVSFNKSYHARYFKHQKLQLSTKLTIKAISRQPRSVTTLNTCRSSRPNPDFTSSPLVTSDILIPKHTPTVIIHYTHIHAHVPISTKPSRSLPFLWVGSAWRRTPRDLFLSISSREKKKKSFIDWRIRTMTSVPVYRGSRVCVSPRSRFFITALRQRGFSSIVAARAWEREKATIRVAATPSSVTGPSYKGGEEHVHRCFCLVCLRKVCVCWRVD